ncbi:hypothetical protein CDD83_4815 [Cordyceps sp. RAO-2017]|nr:hypothetical protein CDD83_4815 [Cordyceps sp. RAO-2017]
MGSRKRASCNVLCSRPARYRRLSRLLARSVRPAGGKGSAGNGASFSRTADEGELDARVGVGASDRELQAPPTAGQSPSMARPGRAEETDDDDDDDDDDDGNGTDKGGGDGDDDDDGR